MTPYSEASSVVFQFTQHTYYNSLSHVQCHYEAAAAAAQLYPYQRLDVRRPKCYRIKGTPCCIKSFGFLFTSCLFLHVKADKLSPSLNHICRSDPVVTRSQSSHPEEHASPSTDGIEAITTTTTSSITTAKRQDLNATVSILLNILSLTLYIIMGCGKFTLIGLRTTYSRMPVFLRVFAFFAALSVLLILLTEHYTSIRFFNDWTGDAPGVAAGRWVLRALMGFVRAVAGLVNRLVEGVAGFLARAGGNLMGLLQPEGVKGWLVWLVVIMVLSQMVRIAVVLRIGGGGGGGGGGGRGEGEVVRAQ